VSSLSSTVSSRTVSGGGATIVKADGTTEFVPRVPGTADLPELEDDDF
jgi:hypothetical protein